MAHPTLDDEYSHLYNQWASACLTISRLRKQLQEREIRCQQLECQLASLKAQVEKLTGDVQS